MFPGDAKVFFGALLFEGCVLRFGVISDTKKKSQSGIEISADFKEVSALRLPCT